MPNSFNATHPGYTPGTPWGFWATIGLGTGIALYWLIAQSVAAVGLLFVIDSSIFQDHASLMESLTNSGDTLAVATICGAFLTTPLILLMMFLRSSYPLRDYLGMRRFRVSQLLPWMGITFLVMLAGDGFTKYVMHRPVVPESMATIYQNTNHYTLLWIALVVAAPVFEELFFRGFLLEGFRHTRMGATGAVLLTSVIWTVIHAQYEGYQLMFLFLVGILLCIAKLRTGSIVLVTLLHAFNNIIATLQMSMHVR